ncbi:uncharacterized protein LOC121368811 [Gigantopelta aegis]|uniref:uncharacterized protein LOC121368811 n=1 Tax=Gigantopelta aegis TaxID=1735272 RepID=UPI001B88D156|nr:uncharacterized protein LOC121368811 [Gigantopelta aegis]
MDFQTLPQTSKCSRKEVRARRLSGRRVAFCSLTSIVLLALLVSVVCLCGSLLLNFSLLIKYGKLSDEVERQSQLLEKVIVDQMSKIPLQTQIEDSFNSAPVNRRYKRKTPNKRKSRKQRRRRCKNQRPRRHTNDRPKPVTHLNGQFNNVTNTVYHGNYFTWRRPHLLFHSSFRYLDTRGAHSVYGIEVVQSGVYVIYSQMAVHGTRRPNIHKTDCAHETVRVRSRNGEEQSEILLKSLLTQDDRGHDQQEGDGTRHFPLDTASHMGIFALKSRDRIFVRRPEQCPHVDYQMDHRYTYFGAFMLHSVP